MQTLVDVPKHEVTHAEHHARPVRIFALRVAQNDEVGPEGGDEDVQQVAVRASRRQKGERTASAARSATGKERETPQRGGGQRSATTAITSDIRTEHGAPEAYMRKQKRPRPKPTTMPSR